jgi:hypothetical protein
MRAWVHLRDTLDALAVALAMLLILLGAYALTLVLLGRPL